jgi:hypothetical protein
MSKPTLCLWISDTHTIHNNRWGYFAFSNPPHSGQDSIVTAIGKWHYNLMFFLRKAILSWQNIHHMWSTNKIVRQKSKHHMHIYDHIKLWSMAIEIIVASIAMAPPWTPSSCLLSCYDHHPCEEPPWKHTKLVHLIANERITWEIKHHKLTRKSLYNNGTTSTRLC